MKKIVCGPDYSAAITTSNRLMVAGSMEHGKLGLGPNQRSGYAQEFVMVSRIRSVIDISCGPTHMLAIVDRNASSGCGVFAWGSNQMGQLGTDSTEPAYLPKEIALKKSERLEQVCAGLDFSLGLARSSKKVYMWGNIKYYGASTSTSHQMHKTPIQIKDLESTRIKKIFCSQTYAYVITETDEIKMWGEWFYERAKSAFQDAGLDSAEEGEDDAEKSEQDEDQSKSEQSSDDESGDESDGDFDYATSESGADSNDGDAKKHEANRRRNNNKDASAKEFHSIGALPETNVKLTTLAFGTNHAAAISEDGLLYTWGHNGTQQLGVALGKYGDSSGSKAQAELISKVHDAAINPQLLKNRERTKEEALATGAAPDEQHEEE